MGFLLVANTPPAKAGFRKSSGNLTGRSSYGFFPKPQVVPAKLPVLCWPAF